MAMSVGSFARHIQLLPRSSSSFVLATSTNSFRQIQFRTKTTTTTTAARVTGCKFFSKKSENHGGKKKKLVIIGSGWGGYKLLLRIDQSAYDVIVVSPRNYFLFTPLLASTSVGTLEFRSIVESVRSAAMREKFFHRISNKIANLFRRKKKGPVAKDGSHHQNINQGGNIVYHQASVNSIDLNSQILSCTSALSDATQFTLNYDKLVIACGAVTNTFGIPGVTEHAFFLKDIQDAKRIRYRILELFEQAAYLHKISGVNAAQAEAKIRQLLHFVVVGGGPTGVEFSAELNDFIEEDLSRMYPQLYDKIEMSLVDVAPTILSNFDISLSEYTASIFAREGISLRTGTTVQRVESTELIIKNGPPIPFGLCVWSTGLKQNPLLDNLKGEIGGKAVTSVVRETKSGRLVTDGYLRVFESRGDNKVPSSNVFAIGDCATIENKDLPCTAQVAKSKGKVLAKYLNEEIQKGIAIESQSPFSHRDMGTMAYVGDWKAVVGMPLTSDGKKKWNESGIVAWLLWRSAYLTFTVSWRNKALIPYYWLLTFLFGRDMSHIK